MENKEKVMAVNFDMWCQSIAAEIGMALSRMGYDMIVNSVEATYRVHEGILDDPYEQSEDPIAVFDDRDCCRDFMKAWEATQHNKYLFVVDMTAQREVGFDDFMKG